MSKIHPHLTIKLLILQSFLSVGLFIGRIFSLIHSRDPVSLGALETIIINRSDRIGDAILTLPLLEIFIEKSREKGYQGRIIILASELNIFILGALEKHPNVSVELSHIQLPAYVEGISSLLSKIKDRLIQVFLVRPSVALDQKTLLLDFMANGDAAVPLYYRKNGNPLIFGLNALTSTILYDRSLPRALVHHSSDNLIETYVSLLEDAIIEMHDLRKDIYTHSMQRFYPSIDEMYPEIFEQDYDMFEHGISECIEWRAYANAIAPSKKQAFKNRLEEIAKEWRTTGKQEKSILLFVGAYSTRSLPISAWQRLITHLSRSLPEYRIILMDGPENIILNQIYREHAGISGENIERFEEVVPLKLFALIASKCSYVIGLDGGGINFVRRFSNSLSIFTFANPLVWQAFTGKKTPNSLQGKNGWRIETFTPREQGDHIGHMARSHFLLPTFNIPDAKGLVENIDENLILEWIAHTK